MKIYNANIVLDDRIIHGYLDIKNGTIRNISTGEPDKIIFGDIDAEDDYLLSGFIDLHTNGILGFDITNGAYSQNNDSFSFDKELYNITLKSALNCYAGKGVTSVFLSTVAAPINLLVKSFQNINAFLEENSDEVISKIVGGLYLEGTFMKLYENRGAHNNEYFKKPTHEIFEELNDASNGLLKIINIVPEWGSEAFNLINVLSKRGLVCAIGHSGATGNEVNRAVESGSKLGVHFLNGPNKTSYKPFNSMGATEAFLKNDSLYLEIIPDGFHVDKSYVLDTIKRKGIEKIIAISDSMFVTELEYFNEFSFLGRHGKISKNGKYIHIAENDEALFGSLLTMDKAFENLLNWLTKEGKGVWNSTHPPLTFSNALLKVSKMCSNNPAKLLGREFNLQGEIKDGSIADLIICNIQNKNNQYKLRVNKTFKLGEIIDRDL